jgi:RHS repeat-associated protein
LTKSSGDANGNLTNDGKFDYQYDSQNRLLSVTSVLSAVNSVRAEFFYDARNRCVLRKYYIKGSQGQWVLNTTDSRALAYDANWNLLAERTLDGKQVGEYILGSRTDEILSAQLGSKTYYPLADGLGSTVALTDKNGAVAERYRTTAFGTPTVLAANYQPRSAANATGYRFLFTGREWLSQVGLNDHRNRYYSPSLGRFINTDPVKFSGGINLYSYVGNNPAVLRDPFGLCCEKEQSDLEAADRNVAEKKQAVDFAQQNYDLDSKAEDDAKNAWDDDTKLRNVALAAAGIDCAALDYKHCAILAIAAGVAIDVEDHAGDAWQTDQQRVALDYRVLGAARSAYTEATSAQASASVALLGCKSKNLFRKPGCPCN